MTGMIQLTGGVLLLDRVSHLVAYKFVVIESTFGKVPLRSMIAFFMCGSLQSLLPTMRDMLPLKRLVKTIAKVVTGDDNVKVTAKSDVFEDNN